MNIKNNIEILRLDDQARGIGYINNKIVFIPNALVGEIVDIVIVKETTKYFIGNVIKYIKKSSKRIYVNCPYYDKCGGCNLLHMSYSDQLEYKYNKLKNILFKYASIDNDIEVIKNKNNFEYRNKVDLKVNNGLWGYYNNSTHDFISIDKCLIAKSSINKVIKYKKYFKLNNGSIVIRSNYNDEILINITTNEEVFVDIDNLKTHIKLVGIIINDIKYYGENYFIEKFNNKFFKVNYNSFFQVNYMVTKEMINIINKNCVGKVLLDLYCGVGFLGQVIEYKFDKIYGVEINKNSILDAINNSKLNNIKNSYYICSDSSNAYKYIKDDIDTLIIDPPRTGLVKDMVRDVMSFKAKRILYVSCNPISLARDLNQLKDIYNIEKIYLLDMFSNTFHVECVVAMILKEHL